MPLTLSALPDDILLQICINLNPNGFLSLVQTCRVLHALVLSDYIWHHINQDLPLDLSSSRDGRLMSLRAPQIQAVVVRALRLDANWRREVSKISCISKMHPPNMVVDMQPLGLNWLVTSYQVRSAIVNISIWRLDTNAKDSSGTISSSCVANIEPENAFSFEAAFEEEGGDTAIISVIGGIDDSQLTIYQLNLRGRETNENTLGTPYLMNSWKIERKSVFYYAQISGSIVAAAIVNILDISCRHQILLFNTGTNVSVMINWPILSEQIKVHVRELPSKIFSSTALPRPPTEEETPSEDWAAAIVDYETTRIRNVEMQISSEPIYLSSLNSFTRNLTFDECQPTHRFSTPPNVTLDPTCLGKTGLRGVWLSHQWNSDEYRLMKGYFPATGNTPSLVVPLQPPELALPFEPHTCRSLYFEEATGRLFVGVHTGDIYILQF
ncbi:hypothetical protein BDZ97DRAFT_1800871 [Flammula alnicola]|nr:hypothetical protein BDZ97DRAFT_1800871 [Flammula alnicola]